MKATMHYSWRVFSVSLLCVLATLNGSAQGPTATEVIAHVEQPRQFGHTIGDVVEQRVLLERNGRPFELAELPRSERHGVWLERRSARIEQVAGGRRWLVMQYQIINAPKTALDIIVVPFDLRDKLGGPDLRVDRWTLSVAPLINSANALDVAASTPRLDRPAPLIETVNLKRNLWFSAGGLAVTLLTWSGWILWRRRSAESSLPFARALRELRGKTNDAPEAWQSVHRAFDATAGCVVHAGSLHRLFERAPQFEAMRPRIETFYAQSSGLFFGSAQSGALLPLVALCKALRRVERKRQS